MTLCTHINTDASLNSAFLIRFSSGGERQLPYPAGPLPLQLTALLAQGNGSSIRGRLFCDAVALTWAAHQRGWWAVAGERVVLTAWGGAPGLPHPPQCTGRPPGEKPHPQVSAVRRRRDPAQWAASRFLQFLSRRCTFKLGVVFPMHFRKLRHKPHVLTMSYYS